MPVDVLDTIFTDVQTLVKSLGLKVPGGAPLLPILIRKGPKREPGVDPLPSMQISMAEEGEKKDYMAFGHIGTHWPIEITMIAKNSGEYLQNLSTYTLYRQQVAALFGPPFSDPLLPTVPGVFGMRIDPDAFLNRDEMAGANIDRWTLKIQVSTAV